MLLDKRSFYQLNSMFFPGTVNVPKLFSATFCRSG